MFSQSIEIHESHFSMRLSKLHIIIKSILQFFVIIVINIHVFVTRHLNIDISFDLNDDSAIL